MNNVVKLSGGDVYLWLEQRSSVMIKAITKHGDPVELEGAEVEQLVTSLQSMLEELRQDD